MVMCIISASLAGLMFLLSVIGAYVGTPRYHNYHYVSYSCVCLHNTVAKSL